MVLLDDYSLMIPLAIALVTASVRFVTSSFWKMFATWVFTVLSLMEREAAISLFAVPCAISRSTPASLSESASGAGA